MTKELLQQAHDALITSLAYVDATSAIAEVQGALKAIEQALAQQEQPAQEAVAYELEAVKFANGKKLVYQKPKNLASYIKVRTLVYADTAPTQPALSDDEILNCFYASKSEGMVAYILAVGRAIEAHCRRGQA